LPKEILKVPPDSTGKPLLVLKKTEGDDIYYLEGVVICDPDGNAIDPRTIRNLTANDLVKVLGSEGIALKQKATTGELLPGLVNVAGTQINPAKEDMDPAYKVAVDKTNPTAWEHLIQLKNTSSTKRVVLRKIIIQADSSSANVSFLLRLHTELQTPGTSLGSPQKLDSNFPNSIVEGYKQSTLGGSLIFDTPIGYISTSVLMDVIDFSINFAPVLRQNQVFDYVPMASITGYFRITFFWNEI